MDILSHALWTNLVFKELPPETRSMAVFFGVMPDIFSFAGVIGRNFLRKTMSFVPPPVKQMPAYVFRLYDISHSLLIFVGIFLLLKLAGFGLIAILFCAWGLHILLDVMTHSAGFFPTPILWPFSRFHFNGVNWYNKWFMLFNYSVLSFLYLVFFF